ncbi:MAG TPA: hypothetical protein VHO70_08725 [Chitinispirillaceae bacterium]|nr:hypothetical protein [Chitinispirillaceae bacterium]
MNSKYHLVRSATKRLLLPLVLLSAITAAYSQSTDSLKSTQDTVTTTASPLPDSLMQQDSLSIKNDSAETQDTIITAVKPSVSDTPVMTPLAATPSDSDTTIDLNGSFLGIRAGWAIGSFDLVNHWQDALPDSLSNFSLLKDSYKIKDSTATTALYMDSTDLRYVIKELPGEYNISIPVGLQYIKISEQRKTSVQLSFAYVGKTQKSVITGLVDSLSESVNIRSNLNTFAFSLEGTYAIPFPEQYFKIDGVDKSYFTLGASISSIIVRIGNDISYGGKSSRMDSVRTAVKSGLSDKTSIGAAISLRAGVTTVKTISNQSLIEFGISYLLSRYDYFYKDSKRLKKEWIRPGLKDSNKPLAFFSNRIEFTVGVFRRTSK